MYRVDEFRKLFDKSAVFDSPDNMFYLTGFRGEGCVLVTPRAAVIITDSRYTEQAERQSPECKVETTGKERGREAIIREYLSAEGINELHVETGVLTVRAYRAMEEKLPGVKLSDMPNITGGMREVKSTQELDCISKAVKISGRAFEALLEKLKPGMTEKQARAVLEYEMYACGADGLAFDTIVASGVNGSLPHAVPSDKVINKGELVTFDFGAKYGGYCSDCTRTVAVGNVSDELKRIYDAVYNAHMAALSEVKPGAVTKELDGIARRYLDGLYPGAFGHSLGHGVGIFIHETPTVNYRDANVLRPGHVITIPPGVYIKGVGGCRIEDTVFVTETGFTDPYTISKQLIVV